MLYPAAMRPAILYPLFAETRSLPGVGPKLEKLIAKALRAGRGRACRSGLPPARGRDRPQLSAEADRAEPGRIATVDVNVLRIICRRRKGRQPPYKVLCRDDTAALEVGVLHAP